MKDEYTSAHDIVKEATVTDYQLPVEVESCSLADKIYSPKFLPLTSFAEEFMKLKGCT